MVESCEKCPYSELFWSVFSHIRTEYGEILRISPYSVRMRQNMDQNNSEYGHSLCSDVVADKQIQNLCGEIANLSENVQCLMNANERLDSEVMVEKKCKQDFRK